MAKSQAVYQLRITLADIRPSIWRCVQVQDCTLSKLHQIIHVCMGWKSFQMWAFEIGGKRYFDDVFDDSALKTKLSQFAPRSLKKFALLHFTWPNWKHRIRMENIFVADPKLRYPLCAKGNRACPPEKCRNPWAYRNCLEI